jgi:hypothetical protein
MEMQKHMGPPMGSQQDPRQMMPMGMDNGMPPGMFESEMIGAIKIKDGLFIGDELASTVSTPQLVTYT